MVKKIKEVDDCLELVKRSESINTVGDIKNRLDECAKKLKSNPLSKDDMKAYEQEFNQVFYEKDQKIKQTHSEKGQGYGYAPQHQKSGQKGIYKSQKRRSL